MQLRPRTVQDCVLNRGPRPMKPRIFVTRPLPPAVLDRLATRCEMRLHPKDTPLSPAQLAEACRDQEGVVVCGARFNEEALLQATRLRVVSNVGVGDHPQAGRLKQGFFVKTRATHHDALLVATRFG